MDGDVVVLVGEAEEVLPEVHDGEGEAPAAGIGAQTPVAKVPYSLGASLAFCSSSSPAAASSSSSSPSFSPTTTATSCNTYFLARVLPRLQQARAARGG